MDENQMRKRSWAVLCGLCLAVACDETKVTERADDGGAVEDGRVDAGSDAMDPSRCEPGPIQKGAGANLPPAQDVDVLFVVDNSPSMKDEQENLAKNIHLMVESLAAGEIRDQKSRLIQSFPPVKSLHLGVTTTNMGLSGAPTRTPANGSIFTPIDSCDGLGDDGLLLNKPDKSVKGCDRSFPPYLAYPGEGVTPTELGDAFGCISRTGSEGCGFEQQLEAAYKALAPSSETSFHRGSGGHGDAENESFLRPNSVLAIVVISDEEDASIPDRSADLFNALEGDKARLNIRQYENPQALHPVSRYVEGFKALRPGHPERVIFAGIVGVPQGSEDLVGPDGQDFDAILKQKDMEFVVTIRGPAPGVTYFANVACVNASVTPASEAYPGGRFVEVAKGFGANGVIRSICDNDYGEALTDVLLPIGKQLARPCRP